MVVDELQMQMQRPRPPEGGLGRRAELLAPMHGGNECSWLFLTL